MFLISGIGTWCWPSTKYPPDSSIEEWPPPNPSSHSSLHSMDPPFWVNSMRVNIYITYEVCRCLQLPYSHDILFARWNIVSTSKWSMEEKWAKKKAKGIGWVIHPTVLRLCTCKSSVIWFWREGMMICMGTCIGWSLEGSDSKSKSMTIDILPSHHSRTLSVQIYIGYIPDSMRRYCGTLTNNLLILQAPT